MAKKAAAKAAKQQCKRAKGARGKRGSAEGGGLFRAIESGRGSKQAERRDGAGGVRLRALEAMRQGGARPV